MDKKIINEGLIRRCVRSEEAAQREFFFLYAPVVKQMAFRYARNKSDAQDIFQESFIAIFTKLNQLKNPQKLIGWIKQIVVRATINYYRKFKQFELDSDLPNSSETPHADTDHDENSELADQLSKIVRELPDGYRMVFNLYLIEGFTHKEIAALLDISVSTSRSQLSKAKKIIRKQYRRFTSKKTVNSYE